MLQLQRVQPLPSISQTMLQKSVINATAARNSVVEQILISWLDEML